MKKDLYAALAEDFSGLASALRSLRVGQEEFSALFLSELTMAQFKALVLLVSTGGLPARGLAERLRVGASAVTPLVDRLVEQGLARREDDPSDRRVSWIRPTEEAELLHERLVNVNRSVIAEIVGDLSAEELAAVQRGIAIFAAAATRRLEAQRSALSNPKDKECPE